MTFKIGNYNNMKDCNFYKFCQRRHADLSAISKNIEQGLLFTESQVVSSRVGAVAADVYGIVQIHQFLFEVFPLGRPCHTIDTWRRVSLKCAVTLSQLVDVMRCAVR
jgi:hypothetical protein